MSEKVLIFANGEINDGPMVRQALSFVAEALVIAADGGARVAGHFKTRVDIVVGDMDSLSPDEITVYRAQGVRVEQHSVHKDETDLELAFITAVAQGATWIRVVSALGGRLDQTMSNIALLALPVLKNCDVALVAGNQEARLLYPGTWTLAGEPGDTVSLIPMSGLVRGITTEALFYPLNDEDLPFGPARGVSNVMNTSAARVRFREGILLVVRTLGRA